LRFATENGRFLGNLYTDGYYGSLTVIKSHRQLIGRYRIHSDIASVFIVYRSLSCSKYRLCRYNYLDVCNCNSLCLNGNND